MLFKNTIFLDTLKCRHFYIFTNYMHIKKHIPNAITCCNLLCGCLAIVQAFEGNLVYAAYLVGAGAIFDFFDGFAARMLKVSSPIGKDLDSLTDMVTFGVVPGVVMYHMIDSAFLLNNGVLEYFADGTSKFLLPNELLESKSLIKYTAFIISIFSAIRLAKFNNDTRQTDSFIGVPTPAVAIFVCSLVLISDHLRLEYNSVVNTISSIADNKTQEGFSKMPYPDVEMGIAYNIFFEVIDNPYVLCSLSLILSMLLVAELPLFALKFKHFKWKDNEIRFVFLGLSLVMLVTLQFIGIPLIIILYIILSVINNLFFKKKVA